MNYAALMLSSIGFIGLAFSANAEQSDFHLTYHVERTPSAQLSIETCGEAVMQKARNTGLRSDIQSYPNQLVTVSGGREGSGAFIAQCIAVGDVTVSVVQGIDYESGKGAIGSFADDAFDAVKAAAD
ncbi:hypothetical protein FPY71_11780 [Aureimonas fodinaquatilis]|uniref:Uncharacterized protein n=1 Tax=Aureimonas fodinaquatilis TaxID=2565783 RepID=A0A5B0DX88_9HYPH|nr:DUF6180 family protein [Aureimonas fodinaquatilis]KAA0971116.1 hypothetical protein FPY71_11780 [Aureimonas fodinaquatilis]